MNEDSELETWVHYNGNDITKTYNWIAVSANTVLNIGVYDIDKLVPLKEGYYTLSTAIDATPDLIKYNKKSGIILFGTANGFSEMWQLKNGTDWWGPNNWVKIESNMYYPLEWDYFTNATLNSLPYYNRKNGMIVSYTEDNVLKYFLYVGENYAEGQDYYNNFIRLIMYDEYKSAIPLYRNIVLVPYCARKDSSDIVGAFLGYEIDLTKLRDDYNISRIIFRSSYYLSSGTIVNYAVYNNSDEISDYYETTKGNYTNEWCEYAIKAEDKKIRVTYLPEKDAGEFGEGYTPEGCYLVPKEFDNYVSKNDSEYKALGGLNEKLYGESSIVFEDSTTLQGSQTYEYDNIGLVHQAEKEETFQIIQLYLLHPGSGANDGTLIVKKGNSVSANGGEILYQEETNSGNFPEYPQLMSIELPNTVTLNPGDKLWAYFTGKCAIRRYLEAEKPSQPGMYFQGSESGNKSTSMILSTVEGDIVKIKKELQGGGKDDILMEYFPSDLFVPVNTRQDFYWNQMLLGDESRTDDSLLNYRITIQFPTSFKGKCYGSDEGISVYHNEEGVYDATVRVYDSGLKNVTTKSIKIHVVAPPSSVTKKNILMMGASWVDINTPDGKGYVYFLDKALKEQGVTLNFVGSKTTNGGALKHEAVGGSTYEYWCGSNSPFWDEEIGGLNVSKYRTQTLQMSENFDYVYIQLGGNEASGGNILDERSFDTLLWQYAEQLYDAILSDSPNCKIFVYLPSNCSPGMSGWSELSISTNGVYGKLFSTYVINKCLIERISSREDFNANLFLSQDHYGLSRRYGFGYIDARNRFFKVDLDSMSEEDINKMKNYDYVNKSIYTTTGQQGFGEFHIRYYDRRGYIVAQIQRGTPIQEQNELLINSNSIPNNDLPTAGTLTKSGGSSSVDYPDIPYTEVLLENNTYKEKWYTNGTHPSIGGYEQLGYCNAAQLIAFIS